MRAPACPLTHPARLFCLPPPSCCQVGLSEDEFLELPRHLRQAAQRGGAEGLLQAGFRPRDGAAAGAGLQQQQQQQQQQQRGAEGGVEVRGGEQPAAGVHGPSWRRQYVFVAATMPAEGERSVGAELAARFPEAAWLAGRQLHQSKRAVEHGWRLVRDEAHRARALQVRRAGCGDWGGWDCG